MEATALLLSVDFELDEPDDLDESDELDEVGELLPLLLLPLVLCLLVPRLSLI